MIKISTKNSIQSLEKNEHLEEAIKKVTVGAENRLVDVAKTKKLRDIQVIGSQLDQRF